MVRLSAGFGVTVACVLALGAPAGCTSFGDEPEPITAGGAEGGADGAVMADAPVQPDGAETDAPPDGLPPKGVGCDPAPCNAGEACCIVFGKPTTCTTSCPTGPTGGWALFCRAKGDCAPGEVCCLQASPGVAEARCAKSCSEYRLCAAGASDCDTGESCLPSSCPGNVRICGKAGSHLIDGPGPNCTY